MRAASGRKKRDRRPKKRSDPVFRDGTIRRVMRQALEGQNLRMGVDDATVRWARELILDRIDFLLREAEQRAWSLGRATITEADVHDVLGQQETDENRRAYLRMRFGRPPAV